jgi:hypothetical protein
LIATTQAILASDLQGIQSFKCLSTHLPESIHFFSSLLTVALSTRDRHTSLQLKEMTILIQRMIQDDFLRFALGKTSEITEAAEAWAALGGEHGTRSHAHSNSIPGMSVLVLTLCVRVLQRATRLRRSDCFTKWAWRNGNLCNTLCVCVWCCVRWVLTLLGCDRLSPLAFGLLRLGKIRQAFQLYREKMQKKVSATIDRVR